MRNEMAPAASPYIPSLDGIRALSFLLVFLAHAGLGEVLIPGGFGVTVFFVLSGFLITTLLRLEFARSGRISLGAFYLRRVLRILPPLYITLVFAMVVHRLGGHPGIPVAGTLAQALQVSNYYQIYASPSVTIPGTDVFWSLAIEEHFYLLFPLLYLWMCGRLPAGRQAVLLLGLCVAVLAWRCLLHFHFHAGLTRVYYGTDTRFDALLFGCVFAIIASPVLRDPLHDWLLRRTFWLLPLCLIVLLGTFLVRDAAFRDTLRYTLQGVALIPLFIAAIHYRKSWPVRFLNLPLVRFVGVLSYSLYLCHSIIIYQCNMLVARGAIGKWVVGPVLIGVVSLAVSLCFAILVYYGVERPCARLRKQLSSGVKG